MRLTNRVGSSDGINVGEIDSCSEVVRVGAGNGSMSVQVGEWDVVERKAGQASKRSYLRLASKRLAPAKARIALYPRFREFGLLAVFSLGQLSSLERYMGGDDYNVYATI